ncbi:MAG TPA: hypothetical protein VNN08_19570 [Thermoanaerobaculia bacterium]|nr:hypothetical protein [Thermoanaerobaculia bacterium]
MSFDPRLEPRWRSVIEPAVSEVSIEGKSLEAHRVDTRSVSDSILTEILSGIGSALLILGDVTAIDSLNGVPLRNPNVFYEIGIAHAMRLPEEVLLFRSDDGPLLFDVANIRVNRYDPDGDPAKTRARVRDLVTASIQEINLTRSLVVESYVTRLDSQAWIALLLAKHKGYLVHPVVRTVGEAVAGRAREAAITSLLELGLIETDYKIDPDLIDTIKRGESAPEQLFRYRPTKLGLAVLQVCMNRLFAPSQASAMYIKE